MHKMVKVLLSKMNHFSKEIHEECRIYLVLVFKKCFLLFKIVFLEHFLKTQIILFWCYVNLLFILYSCCYKKIKKEPNVLFIFYLFSFGFSFEKKN